MVIRSTVIRMGRKKKGYKAPEGLVKMPGSPFWYVHIGNICKSTKTSDLVKATLILREVQKRLLEKEMESRARVIVGDEVSLKTAAERYLREESTGKVSERSDRTNSIHPIQYFADAPIDGIKPKDIYSFFDWRRKQISKQTGKPVSGPTMNREKSFISEVMKKSIKWGYLDKNICNQVEEFPENKRKRYITDEEFKATKKIARNTPKAEHLPDIMDCLYQTGQRSGRIFQFKWPQINLEKRVITFDDGPENKRAPDEIWINDTLFMVLSRLKAQRSFRKVVGQYVFQKPNGKPYGRIKTTWNNCCKKAGVLDAHIHDIRHKTLTDMGKAGHPLQKIAQAGGHKEISTTMRYTHLRAEDTREAFESLARI